MKAYQFIEEKEIQELETMARVYEHKKTGAKVLCLENKDDNKVFSIAFRTPAEDSTGVAHITEHSVLCGSKKFPLKDPFVELVKGSLKTFLNAMTYPDKTVYPVASQNDKDFQNLMDVYLDAVFHPNCLENYRTFLQEGWHYTLDEKGNLGYSGVVYNEMRGAFSEPESVLERYIFHSLFPDTTYGNESGGDPEDIPNLTYEAFQAFHARYYHPSNSYIILYGDMDMEEKLNWLDAQYLAKYERINPDSEIARQKSFSAMVEETEYYPISKEEKAEGKAYFSYNFEHLSLRKLIATCYKNQNSDLFSQNDSEQAVYLEYTGDKDGNGIPTPDEIAVKPLKGDGDFRSEECIKLLKQADIVVTNPPFSLFREYVAQLVEYGKHFIIIGNKNAITYKEIFPLIKDNKMWLGSTPMGTDMLFGVPDNYAEILVEVDAVVSNQRILSFKLPLSFTQIRA